MNLYDVFEDLEKNTDDEKSKSMGRYMRDQFSFLGIQATKRKEIINTYLKEAKKQSILTGSLLIFPGKALIGKPSTLLLNI